MIPSVLLALHLGGMMLLPLPQTAYFALLGCAARSRDAGRLHRTARALAWVDVRLTPVGGTLLGLTGSALHLGVPQDGHAWPLLVAKLAALPIAFLLWRTGVVPSMRRLRDLSRGSPRPGDDPAVLGALRAFYFFGAVSLAPIYAAIALSWVTLR